MSSSQNSLKGGYIGDFIGTIIGLTKGDTRSLDKSSYTYPEHVLKLLLPTSEVPKYWILGSPGVFNAYIHPLSISLSSVLSV